MDSLTCAPASCRQNAQVADTEHSCGQSVVKIASISAATAARRPALTLVPPAGCEPALPPPEGDALSPELRGLGEAEISSRRGMIIGVEVVPVASPM